MIVIDIPQYGLLNQYAAHIAETSEQSLHEFVESNPIATRLYRHAWMADEERNVTLREFALTKLSEYFYYQVQKPTLAQFMRELDSKEEE